VKVHQIVLDVAQCELLMEIACLALTDLMLC